jgi:ribulose 1,5-bisphosphate synthetase/thiazole synthase
VCLCVNNVDIYRMAVRLMPKALSDSVVTFVLVVGTGWSGLRIGTDGGHL